MKDEGFNHSGGQQPASPNISPKAFLYEDPFLLLLLGLFRFIEMFFIYGFSFYLLPSDQGRQPLAVHEGPVSH